MKPKISLKWLLLLLSAVAESSSGEHPNQKSNRGIIHGSANSTSLMQGNTRSTVGKECQDFNQIARWINHQVVVTGKLTRFNQRLGQLLLALNDSAPIEHCCFYEKTTMVKVMDYLNNLADDQGSSVQGNLNPLKTSGELGQDLDNILTQMGKLISRDVRSCCDQLVEDLKKQEEDLQKSLEEQRKRLEKANGANGKAVEELQKKQAELEKQLADLREQLEKLEEKLRKSGESLSAKCCAEVDKKLRDLEGQATTVKNEGIDKTKEFEKKLDDLENGQKDHEDKLDDIQRTINERNGSISNAIDMCKENCGNGTNGESNLGTSDLETRIEALQKQVKDLSARIADVIPSGVTFDMKENMKSCQDIGKLLANIETQLQQVMKGQNPAGENEISAHLTDEELKERFKDLEGQVKELQIEVGRSRHCCKFLDGIGNIDSELQLDVDTINKTFTDHISDLEKKMGDLRKQVDGAFAKIKKLGPANGNGSDDLDRLKENLDKFPRDIDNLRTQLDKMLGHISVLTKMIKDKFAMTEDLKTRLLRLEKVCEDLGKDVERALKLVQRIVDLEKLLDDALEKQKKLEIEVNSCLGKCKAMDSIDDLIDRIEDLEKVVKPKVPTTQRPRRKKKFKRTTTTEIAWVGGIDMVTPFVQD